MLYEAESGDISMAITGESLITRGMSVFREPRFTTMREQLHGSDVRFTNAEMLFHNYEDPPTHRPGGTYMRCDPKHIDDLKWLGINMVGCANNHSYDFGENGILTNIKHLDEYDMPHAGTGRHLAEATAPMYMDTPKGRVALISATTTSPPGGRAGEASRDVMGRPGANVIRWSSEFTVDRPAFDSLQRSRSGFVFTSCPLVLVCKGYVAGGSVGRRRIQAAIRTASTRRAPRDAMK